MGATGTGPEEKTARARLEAISGKQVQSWAFPGKPETPNQERSQTTWRQDSVLSEASMGMKSKQSHAGAKES